MKYRISGIGIGVVCVLLAMSGQQVAATEIFWKSTTGGAFSTGANWVGNVAPGPIDTAHWTNLSVGAAITWSADAVTANARFSKDSGLGDVRPTVGAGNTYTVTNVLDVGYSGSGSYKFYAKSGTVAVTNAGGTAVMNWRTPPGGTQWMLWGGDLVVDHFYIVTNSPWGAPYQFYPSGAGTFTTKGDSEMITTTTGGSGVRLGHFGPSTWRIAGGSNRVHSSVYIGSAQPADVIVDGTNSQLVINNGLTTLVAGSRLIVTNGASGRAGTGFLQGKNQRWLISGPDSRLALGGQLYAGHGGAQTNSHIRIENGGSMTVGTQTYLCSSANAKNIGIVVDGPGSRFYGGSSVEVGDNSGTEGWVQIANGGELSVVSWSGLYVGNTVVGNGSGWVLATSGGILDCNRLVTGSSGSGAITNDGGVFQFSTATPTITPGTAGTIVITDGTIAFRSMTTASVTWQSANITYQGNNGFRLNSCTNSSSANQTYVFDTGMGADHYQRLEMVNGSTLYRGQAGNTLTIGSGGEMLASNTAAVVDLVFTNSGTLTIVNSTVTFNQPAVLQGTLQIDLDNLATTTGVLVAGNLDIGPSSTLVLTGTLPFEDTTLCTYSGTRSGTFTTVTGLPETYGVRYGAAANGSIELFQITGTVITVR